MDWREHRVLVTGATGMVGSWLVRRLLGEGAFVVAFIRDWDPNSELIRSGDVYATTVVNGQLESFGDVERAINEHEVDTVFHLGAQTLVGPAYRSPLPTFESNIRGTYNLLEACRQHRGLVQRVVVASSDKAYGQVEQLPYTEDMPVQGLHPYDVSKSCTDLLARTFAQTYDLPVTVARCGNIYGGGDLNWSRIVPDTIRSTLQNRPVVLRSDGRYIRDYIYVKDVVEAYMLLAERAANDGVRGEAFNFGLESRVTVLQIAGKVLELMGRTDLEPVIANTATAEIKDQYLHCGKARKVLNWRHRYSLEEGLKETIAWYRDFFDGK